MKLWPVVSFLLAVGLVICFVTRPSGPVVDAGRDQHLDSVPLMRATTDTSIVHLDTAIARAKRDSSVEQLRDSAAAMGRRLDARDRAYAKIQREKSAAARAASRSTDSLLAVVDSMADNQLPPSVLDTITPAMIIPADTGLSCEARYAGRLAQLVVLGQALERCIGRRDTLLAIIVGVRDTLGRIRHFAAASDSLLRWERDRPRPCQVDLWVKKVGCGKAMGGTAMLTTVFWLMVRR